MGTLYFPTLKKRESWSLYMQNLNSCEVNDSTMKFFSAVRFFKCQPEICPDTERTSDFCTTSVQMPRARARRYCGTMYFPTLSKRELWSEYMKDLKSHLQPLHPRFRWSELLLLSPAAGVAPFTFKRSYAVGRRRALHQHRSVHPLLHLPA